MNVTQAQEPEARRPRVLRWVVWMVLIAVGGTVVGGVVEAIVGAATDGLDVGKLLVWVFIGALALVLMGLRSWLNPINRRPDQMSQWRRQFPGHSEQEIRRFIQTVGEPLVLRDASIPRLSPDDRPADVSRAFGGDGMDVVEMAMAVEREYALRLPENPSEGPQTLGELFCYVTRDAPTLARRLMARDPTGPGRASPK